MGLVLVTGGATSGKSAFAERYARRAGQLLGAPTIYLATMERSGSEAETRIARHRAQREGKGFATIERPRGIHHPPLSGRPIVLLECVGTLLANEMFATEPPTRPAESVTEQILSLVPQARLVVAVSNIICCDSRQYDRATEDYIAALEQVQIQLAAAAKRVYEVVCGIPLRIKRSG